VRRKGTNKPYCGDAPSASRITHTTMSERSYTPHTVCGPRTSRATRGATPTRSRAPQCARSPSCPHCLSALRPARPLHRPYECVAEVCNARPNISTKRPRARRAPLVQYSRSNLLPLALPKHSICRQRGAPHTRGVHRACARHATAAPRHATPRHATPQRATPQHCAAPTRSRHGARGCQSSRSRHGQGPCVGPSDPPQSPQIARGVSDRARRFTARAFVAAGGGGRHRRRRRGRG